MTTRRNASGWKLPKSRIRKIKFSGGAEFLDHYTVSLFRLNPFRTAADKGRSRSRPDLGILQ